jgi:antitoxin MazE
MRTRIVRIGDSHGIRIPKLLIKQIGLRDEVEIDTQDNALLVRPVEKLRARWAVAFQEMARRGDDALLDEGAPTATGWDENVWEWQ